MKKRRSGTNTSKVVGKSVQGTGKHHATAPRQTHMKPGAITTPRKAKGPLDNRGKGGPDGYQYKKRRGK